MKVNWQTKKLKNFCINVPFVSQISKNACGAAVLEMVYGYYGLKNISQKAIFDKYKRLEPHGSGNNIISTSNLVSDASGRGFLSFWAKVDYTSKEDSRDLFIRLVMNSKIPIIACQKFTDKEPLIGHFRIVVGVKDNIVYVHDPFLMDGAFQEWDIDKFMDYWQPTGQNVTGGVFIVIKKI